MPFRRADRILFDPPTRRSMSVKLFFFFGSSGNSGKRGKLGPPLTPLCVGARVLRNRWKRKVNGRQKRDGNGKDPSGTTTTMTRPSAACSRLPHASQQAPVPRGHSRWGKKRASIASSSKIGSRNETSSSARSCRCRAVSVDRQLPFPENGASVTGISSPTFDRWVPHPGNPGRTQICHGDDLPNL